MEARIAKPGKTLTSNYWLANFKLDENNTEFKQENRKKTYIVIYDIAQRAKIFSLNIKKLYVEKALTWRDSEARI